MAERGGYRRPSERSPTAPGIGRNSKRTDRQAIRSPNVQDSTDLTQGDRERIRQGQRIAPLSRAAPARVTPPPTGTAVASGRQGELPQFLFERPTDRLLEPETAGMDMGAGPGSEILTPSPPEDDREVVLRYLAAQPNAPEGIARMLDAMRAEREVVMEQPEPPIAYEGPSGPESLEDLEEEPEEPTTIELQIPPEEVLTEEGVPSPS